MVKVTKAMIQILRHDKLANDVINLIDHLNWKRLINGTMGTVIA
jgi:uncharacterized heparinase superfamily protein